MISSLLTASVLFSCASTAVEPLDIPAREDVARVKIVDLLEQGESAESIMLIDSWRIRNGWEGDWLQTAEQRAIELLAQDLDAAMNELDSVAAHRFLASLQTSGGTSRYTESDILQMEFRQELAAGRSPRAVMAFLQLASYGVPAEDDIQAAFDLIESLQDRYAMEVAGNLLRQHGYTGYVQRDIAEVASADQVPGVGCKPQNKELLNCLLRI